MRIFRLAALSLPLLTAFALAQASQTTPTDASKPDATSKSATSKPVVPRTPRKRQPTCWKQAGMTADMVNKRWKLEDDGKVKIAKACTDTSLNPQQKHDRIQQINADTDQAIAKLIPAKELEAYKSCQAAWDKAHPKPAAKKELGPCGGTIPPNAAAADHSSMDTSPK